MFLSIFVVIHGVDVVDSVVVVVVVVVVFVLLLWFFLSAFVIG